LKIAILHTDFRIYWPARLKSLHNSLNEKGHELIVLEIAGKGSPYSFASHSDVSGFPGWKILFPDERIEDISAEIANNAIYKTLNELNPDVLLSGALAFYSGAAAVRWAGSNNKPLIVFDDARLIDVQRNFLVNFYKKQLYKLSDAIFCPAPSLDNSYNFWGFRKEDIFYGLNCVDNQFFLQKKDVQKVDLPEKYFLCVGRQVQKKNMAGLLHAYKQYLTKSGNNGISLVIVGEGPEHTSLETIAGNLMGKNVYFLPYLSQDNLVPVMQSCTAYVLPSLYGETWGLTVNEAMACEKPVVVSNQCGCCSTLVIPGLNGWTFDPINVDDLASIMVEISQTSAEKLYQMGKKSGEIISNWGLERFNEGVWAATEYSVEKNNSRNKRIKLLPRLLAHFWKGRFRPEMPL
jgi:glycosyltransferase involved in cell wall biosynthesis